MKTAEQASEDLHRLLDAAHARFPEVGFDSSISSLAWLDDSENSAADVPENDAQLIQRILLNVVDFLASQLISNHRGYKRIVRQFNKSYPSSNSLGSLIASAICVERFNSFFTSREEGSFWSSEIALFKSCHTALMLTAKQYTDELVVEFAEINSFSIALEKLNLSTADPAYSRFHNQCDSFVAALDKFNNNQKAQDFIKIVQSYANMMFYYRTATARLSDNHFSAKWGGHVPRAVHAAVSLTTDDVWECAQVIKWLEVAAVALARIDSPHEDCNCYFDLALQDALARYNHYGVHSGNEKFRKNLGTLFNSRAYAHISPKGRLRLIKYIDRETPPVLRSQETISFVRKLDKATRHIFNGIPAGGAKRKAKTDGVKAREKRLQLIHNLYHGHLVVSEKLDGDTRRALFGASDKLQRKFDYWSGKICSEIVPVVESYLHSGAAFDYAVAGETFDSLRQKVDEALGEVDKLLEALGFPVVPCEDKDAMQKRINDKMAYLRGEISLAELFQRTRDIEQKNITSEPVANLVIKLQGKIKEYNAIVGQQKALAVTEILPELSKMRDELIDKKLRTRIRKIQAAHDAGQDAVVVKRVEAWQRKNPLARCLSRLLGKKAPEVSAGQAVRLISENSDNMQLVTYFLSGATAHRMSGEQLAGLYDIDGIDSRLLDKKIQGNSKLRRRYDAAVSRVQQEDFVLGTQRVITDKLVASRSTTAQVTSSLQKVPQPDATSTDFVERVTPGNYLIFSRTPTESGIDAISEYSQAGTVASADTEQTDCTDKTDGIVGDACLAALDSPARGRPPVIERIEGNGKEVIGRIEEGETSSFVCSLG